MTGPATTTALIEALRHDLAAIIEQSNPTADLHLVKDPRQDQPTIYRVPTSADLATELAAMCVLSARSATVCEFITWQPDYKAGSNQRIIRAAGDDPLTRLDARFRRTPTFPDYDDAVSLSESSNVLVVRLFAESGDQLARFYQRLGSAKALERSRRRTLLWQNETFRRVHTQTLVLEEDLRLAATDHGVVMTQPAVYEQLFGALPELASQADATYTATLGRLDIEGADQLAEACRTDLNMMRKLASIQAKLDDPAYQEQLTQERLVSFIRDNPHVAVSLLEVDGQTKIVFDRGPQHRWAILKLLDDDYLRSDLTDAYYTSNSKARS